MKDTVIKFIFVTTTILLSSTLHTHTYTNHYCTVIASNPLCMAFYISVTELGRNHFLSNEIFVAQILRKLLKNNVSHFFISYQNCTFCFCFLIGQAFLLCFKQHMNRHFVCETPQGDHKCQGFRFWCHAVLSLSPPGAESLAPEGVQRAALLFFYWLVFNSEMLRLEVWNVILVSQIRDFPPLSPVLCFKGKKRCENPHEQHNMSYLCLENVWKLVRLLKWKVFLTSAELVWE